MHADDSPCIGVLYRACGVLCAPILAPTSRDSGSTSQSGSRSKGFDGMFIVAPFNADLSSGTSCSM